MQNPISQREAAAPKPAGCSVVAMDTPSDETMVYVAADPKQPGAAWACFVDEPSYTAKIKADMAKEIASRVRKGAVVQRVPVEQARAMMAAWVRPQRRAKKQNHL